MWMLLHLMASLFIQTQFIHCFCKLNLYNFLSSPLVRLVSFRYSVFQVINSVASSSLLFIP